MTTEDEETAWEAGFDRLGELLVYDNVKQGAIDNDVPATAVSRWPHPARSVPARS